PTTLTFYVYFVHSSSLDNTVFPYTTLFRSGYDLNNRIRRPSHHQFFSDGGTRGRYLFPADDCCAQRSFRCDGHFRFANAHAHRADRKSTRLNSSHVSFPYAVLCLKNKK